MQPINQSTAVETEKTTGSETEQKPPNHHPTTYGGGACPLAPLAPLAGGGACAMPRGGGGRWPAALGGGPLPGGGACLLAALGGGPLPGWWRMVEEKAR